METSCKAGGKNNPNFFFFPKNVSVHEIHKIRKEITIVVIMMEYIQELRGWDLYSLQVGVCHVFSVCQALKPWDRCCENGSVMSPVFKWSSALPSDDGKRPAHLCLRAPQVARALVTYCWATQMWDAFKSGLLSARMSQTPTEPIDTNKTQNRNCGTFGHKKNAILQSDVHEVRFMETVTPALIINKKCDNYSLTCFDFFGQEVFISFFICYFYIAIFFPAIY